MSNSRSRGDATINRFLWAVEILCAAAFFLCVVATSYSLRSVNKIAAEKISVLENRLSFIRRFPLPSGLLVKPGMGHADAGQVMSDIRGLAFETGAVIERFSFGPETRSAKDKVYVLPVELSVTVAQNVFPHFVSGLKKLSFLSRITFLSARPDPSGDENLRLTLKVERLRLSSPVSQEVLSKAAMDFELPVPESRLPVPKNARIFKNRIRSGRSMVNVPLPSGEAFDVGNYGLVGIVNDGSLKAVVEDKRAGKSCFLSQDDEIGGMRVAEILEQEVVLEGVSGRYSLIL